MSKKNLSAFSLKTQAKALRRYLAEQGVELGHSKCLEAVARAHGHKNWDTAVASLVPENPLSASVSEARSMARALRSEAGWEESWPFPWESREEARGPGKGLGPTACGNSTFTIEVEMRDRWVPHFLSMLSYMQKLGDRGSSRRVTFFADGDGDFQPKFSWDFVEHTDVAPREDDDGHRLYDAG